MEGLTGNRGLRLHLLCPQINSTAALLESLWMALPYPGGEVLG